MKLPRQPEDLIPALAALGIAIATSKLLASKRALKVRQVAARALEGALLAMCGGVALLIRPDADPFAMLGLGGLLAALGIDGLIKLVRAIRSGREE